MSAIHGEGLASLRALQPLAALSDERLGELLPLARRASCQRGENPLETRDWNGQIVYLVKGELILDSGDGGKQVLVGGSGRALLPIRRQGLVPKTKAITEVDLLGLPEDPVDVMVTWDQLVLPLFNKGAGKAAKKTAEATDWRQMSGMFAVGNLTSGVFSMLPPAHIGELLERFVRHPAKRGDVIVRQGEEGDFYYLIERGRCRVSRMVGGVEMVLAELKAGDAFGEEALVADSQRNATVSMKTDGVLLRLSKADFNTMLREPLLQRLAPAEARRKQTEGAVWVDVRFPAEFQQERLPGAINIPLNEIRTAAATLDMQREYIVYCQTGRRSSAAAFLLSQKGIKAWLLDGGLKSLGESAEAKS